MGRLNHTLGRSRLNLKIHPTVRARLEELRDDTLADSITEVIRRAVAIYDLLLTNDKEGGSVVIRNKDGSEKEVLLID